ncbi:hypothetical protein C8Q77DRAFT_1064483, partial [Trametes polyzona]
AMPFSEANSRLMLIDDRDPAVQYEGSWDRVAYFGDSMSISSTPKASVSMEFDGTRIIVAALAEPAEWGYTAPPTVQFAIDGAVVETVSAPTFTDWTFYAMFDSQGLADGNHTVNVTVLEATRDYPFILDNFMFQPSKQYWHLAFAPSTLDVTEGEDGSGEGAGSGHKTASRGRPNMGAIVGGVLGGLALLAVAITAFLWWRRRRQHAYTSLDGTDSGERRPPSSPKAVTPFTSIRPFSMFTTDSKRAYSDPLESYPSDGPSSSTPSHPTHETTAPSSAPSVYSDTGATAASASPVTDTAEHADAPNTTSGRAGPSTGPTQKEPQHIVEEAIRGPRRNTGGGESDSTPSEAPPRYSER